MGRLLLSVMFVVGVVSLPGCGEDSAKTATPAANPTPAQGGADQAPPPKKPGGRLPKG